MRLVDDGSTSPQLLGEVANWTDHSAWVRFRARYDRMLQSWCRGYGLDDDATDEVSQQIWIELAGRMRTFQYDPTRTFRGWLRRFCESRVIDFLRRRQAHPLLSLDDRDDERIAGSHAIECDVADMDDGDDEGASDPARLVYLRKVEQAQASVRGRVKPHNWEAFWLVAVCDWSVERTAEALGMTHAAVYAARERVAKMLREEGERLSAGEPSGL